MMTDVEHNHYEPPMIASESHRPATSVPRGFGFGCLYMIAAFFGFGTLLALVAPLIFRNNLEEIGKLGAVIGMFVVAPLAGLIGFLRHRILKAS
jgi:hypothetical protein